MTRRAALSAVAGLAALCACNPRGAPQPDSERQNQQRAEPETVEIPQTVTEVAPGTTPMAQRVAVLGLLNKRNGISRQLTLRPGQAVRYGDTIVRLRACETTAPWEEQRLTGAFVQLDVRNPEGRFQRVFSGWLYKESPSLNVVEHPIYDVWPKSCAMTHPGAGPAEALPGSPRTRWRAPKSAAPAAEGSRAEESDRR